MSSADSHHAEGFSDRSSSARRTIEWIVAVLLVVVGLATAGSGGLVLAFADRDRITELVEDEVIESDIFTHAELIDLIVNGAWWGGLGIFLGGVAIVLVGLWFGWQRYRIDQLDEEGVPASFVSTALLGAVVTVITSFIPFSALIGGGFAGYIHLDDPWGGAWVGAFAGILLAIPTAIFLVMLVVGLVMADFLVLAFILVVGGLFVGIFNIALSAIGGYIGAYFRERN